MLLVWEPGAAVSVSALLIVGACVAWGIDNIATSRIDQIAPQHVTFLKGAVAGTVNLLLAVAVTGMGTVTMWSLLGALVVGALGYGASITLWVRGAHQLGAARGSGDLRLGAVPRRGRVVGRADRSGGAGAGRGNVDRLVRNRLSLRSSHLHHHEHDPLVHLHEHDHADGHHNHAHDEGVTGRHLHLHEHRPLVHAHPHVPDLHHRHDH